MPWLKNDLLSVYMKSLFRLLFCAVVVVLMPCLGHAATNLALNKPVIASSVYGGYGPELTVDGNFGIGWSAGSQGSLANPHWIKMDLGAVYSIDHVILYGGDSGGMYEGFTKDYQLYGSLDDSLWTLKASGTLLDTASPVLHDANISFAPANYRYIRVDGVGGSHWFGLEEIEVFQAVPEPSVCFLVTAGLFAVLAVAKRSKQ